MQAFRVAIRVAVAGLLVAPGLARAQYETLRPEAPQSAQALRQMLQRQGLLETTEEGRPVVRMGLDDALQLALERSTALQRTRLGETIARSNVTAARERRFPTMENTLESGRSVSAFTTFGSRTDAVRFQSSVNQTLNNGWQVGATFSEVRSEVKSFNITADGEVSFAGGTSTFETSALTGELSIPFFQDAGSDFNQAPVRIAQAGLRSSRMTTRDARLQLLRQVAGTYWNLVRQRETIRVRRDAVALSRRLLEDNRARLEAGVLSPADVKVSETQLAEDRQALLQARTEFQRIQDEIRAALDLENLEVGLEPTAQPGLHDVPLSVQRLRDKAFQSDPQLQQVQARLERNRHELVQVRNDARTDLDLGLRYTLNGYGEDTSTAVSGLSETELHGYGATITWTVPLFDQVTPQRIRQKRLERVQLELQARNLRTRLTVRVQQVMRQLRLAEEQVRTARQSVDLQRQLLQNEIERLRLGESTSFQVAQVQQDNALARLREVEARIRYQEIFLELLLVTGDIYAQYGLSEDDQP